MSQFGFLGNVIGGMVAGPVGWLVGGLAGNEMDRQEREGEIDSHYDHEPSTYSREERILTINELQMTQLIKQALEEARTRGPFESATFEQVENSSGYIVSLNFKKQ